MRYKLMVETFESGMKMKHAVNNISNSVFIQKKKIWKIQLKFPSLYIQHEENFKLTFHSMHNDSNRIAFTPRGEEMSSTTNTQIWERENFHENHKFCTFHLILLKFNFHCFLHFLHTSTKARNDIFSRIHMKVLYFSLIWLCWRNLSWKLRFYLILFEKVFQIFEENFLLISKWKAETIFS